MTALNTVASLNSAKIAPPLTLDDIADIDLLLPRLTATSKIGAIKELTDLLHERHVITDRLGFLQAVLEREQLQSTVLNNEVALPHARGRCVDSLGLAMGIAPAPIDFPSGDECSTVRLICLIAVPAHAPDLYLNLLGMLARILSSNQRRRDFLQAESAEQMQQLLLESA
ncbi:MAG: PTS sugar transporter subunit IIA [Candidatus Latescibacterota bacterium]